MIRISLAVLAIAVASAGQRHGGRGSADAQVAIEKALAGIGCTVEADDVDTTDDGYEADDVRCKGGEFEVSFDKDFKITSKEKDEY